MTETLVINNRGRPISRILTIPDLISFSYKGEKRTTNTYTSYCRNLQGFLERNKLTLETMKPLHAKAFIQEMGQYDPQTSTYLEMNTAASYKRFMRTLFNNLGREADAKMLRNNNRDVSPIDKFKINIPTEEIYKLIQVTLEDKKCNYSKELAFAFSLMAFEGFRPSETLGLYFSDVDVANKKVSLVRHLNEKYFPKATKVSDTPIINPLSEFCLHLFLAFASSDTSKVNERILQIGYCTFKTRFYKYIKTAEVKDIEGNKITPHKMRHVFGHLWRNNKGDLQVLKELLRHSDIKITMLYSAPTNTEITSEFDKTINDNIHSK
jgi:integrase/recombinase XerD